MTALTPQLMSSVPRFRLRLPAGLCPYVPGRNEEGAFLGCLGTVQDVAHSRTLTGQKRASLHGLTSGCGGHRVSK